MTAYIDRMPAGWPGDVTRPAGLVLEPAVVGATAVPYGAPVKISGGKVVLLEEDDTAADLYGFATRSYPSQGGAVPVAGALGPGSLCDVLRSGYLLVPLAAGTAALGGAVYVRLGDIEAASAEGNVPIGATFLGEADASGNVEICFNI
jgi:hypothetical protein